MKLRGIVVLSNIFVGVVKAKEKSCIVGGFHLPDISGPCNYNNVFTAFIEVFKDPLITSPECDHTAEEDLRYLLGVSKGKGVENSIDDSCKAAMDNAMKIPFNQISRESDQFEKVFYNGGTYWNEETETNLESADGNPTNKLKDDAKNVRYFYNYLAQTTHVEWPGQLTNFDLETCEMNAAYCCWPRDRQANDNNGNCATPYDTNCIDKDPADNTDLCYVDNGRGNLSTGIDNGFSVYDLDNNDGEGPIHCHGFAWSNDEYDFTSRYKANNLFFVSMYDHMHQRGYVQNLAGAPMCACAEQMPTVTRSDCTQIDVDEVYKFEYHPSKLSFSARLAELEIDFNACEGINNRNNDLSAYMGQLHQEGKVSSLQREKLRKHLVENGNCPYATTAMLNEKGYVRGYNHDESLWVKVVGRDSLAAPSLGREGFRTIFEQSPNKIVLRVCITCNKSHQFIYYKRITPLPEDMDLQDYLKNHWKSESNSLNVDFKLFSTYQEALAETNPWQVCNYDHSHIGFPRECGPESIVRNQWSKFEWRGGKSDVAFYVEKSQFEFIDGNGKDIGGVALPGQTLEADGKYYMTASGSDIWSTQDEFHFASEEANGDMNLVVKLSSLDNRDGWTKAGLMIRDTLNPDSKFVMLVLSRTYGVSMQYRTETSQHAGWSHSGLSAMEESWMKLTRRGNAYEGYRSDNGLDWIKVGNTVTAVFEDEANDYVGMVLTSHRDGYYAEAVFEKYNFEQYYYPSAAPSESSAPSAFVLSRDIGNVGVPGSASEAGDSYIIKGSGWDIWGTSDRFHFMSKVTTDASNDGVLRMIVKMSSFADTEYWSKGGLMIRDTLEHNSKFVMVVNTGGAGPSMMWRSDTGGHCGHATSWKDRDSVWLKLEKNANTLSAYWSDDNNYWNRLSDVNVDMKDSFHVGLAVTSHNDNQIATAHFDHYSMDSFTMSPTISPVPTATPRFALGAAQNGFCVKSDGHDQNSGVYKLSNKNFSQELFKECKKLCLQSNHDTITGCEAIWDQGNAGCYVHTQSVARGNGVGRHMCWIATSL